MPHSSSLDDIIRVAERLGPWREKVVFLGGAVTGLLITDPAASEVRNTDDVDVIVEAATRGSYYRMTEELQHLGFVQRHEPGDPICRWTIAGVIVDLMPTDETILGFGNRWYQPAIRNAATINVSPSLPIRVITAPYFIATKLAAFQHRGGGDFLASRDMADIMSVFDGREELMEEIMGAEEALRSFLTATFQEYLAREDFREAIAGHLLPDAASQARLPLLIHRIRQAILI